MAITKPKKASQTPEGVQALKSDVASFISSLGLAPPPVAAGGGGAATASYGFDDSDFRKSGPIKPSADFGLDFDSDADADGSDEKKKKKAGEERDKDDVKKKKKSKPHPLQLDPFAKDAKANNNNKNTSELPLMKASTSSGQWYVDAEELEAKVLGSDGRKKVAAVGIEELKRLVEEKTEVAERLMLQYAEDYQRSKRKNGDMRLLEVTARSGTSADKVSAFTCLVEDNPIGNIRSLDALLSMVTSKVGKRYAFTGFEALRELFLQRLLPDHKLKSLFQRPLDILPETKDGHSLLLFWHWEQCLKQRYEKFVIALEEALKDMLPNLKDKAMKTVFLLLKSKPEQERRLLSALVNKLGDPERKAASSAMYNLSCLLSAHPNMKAVVIDEVDTFLFRPNIGMRAKYVAVNFLSQILLSKKGDGPKVAKRLIDVYFALFKVLISESEGGKVNKHEKKNGAHGRGKRKEDETRKTMSDKNRVPLEANVEMDSRVLSALLTGINRAFPFVASDEADTVIEVQTPMLFRLVHAKNFNVGVQALMLLYQISSKNQIASDRFYRALYAKLLDATALSSSKPELFLGLLVKAMKNDLNMKRVAAFSKRLLQIALQRPPQYACGCLFILSEVLKAKPPLWSIVLQSETVDDEIEHFKDIIEEDPEEIVPCNANVGCFADTDCGKKLQGSDSKDEHALKYPSSSINIEDDPTPHTGLSLPGGYNPRHREPSYCNADRTSWWELSVLASHVHPSVATMAQTLLSGANIVYNGDPLTDLSLTAFIDKFMEKKPKANRIAEGGWYGGSQIAPARKLNLNNRLIGEEILQLDEDEVPPEDVVFHRFYLNKLNSSKVKTKKKKASEDDAEDFLANESDESDEEEINNMLGSAPLPLEEDEGEYDYDDLDRIADEDDDDLLGNDSDAETGPPSSSRRKDGNAHVDAADEHEDGDLEMWDSNPGEGGNDFDDAISSDAGNDSEDEPIKSKPKKQKLDGRARASPFASLEDYEHLLGEEAAGTKKSKPRKDSKRKKKKSN